MTWQVRYELKWFSDQQSDLSYFARDEQRTAWGILLMLTIDHFQASTWSENHESLHFLHASLSKKSINHTSPSRKCKMCFWANMQISSTLWLDIKSQKISEHWFRLKWTKSGSRTQLRQAKTDQDQCGPDKKAQDSLLDEAGGGWCPWAVGRPP